MGNIAVTGAKEKVGSAHISESDGKKEVETSSNSTEYK